MSFDSVQGDQSEFLVEMRFGTNCRIRFASRELPRAHQNFRFRPDRTFPVKRSAPAAEVIYRILAGLLGDMDSNYLPQGLCLSRVQAESKVRLMSQIEPGGLPVPRISYVREVLFFKKGRDAL